ncbi:MAG TPA: SUMF1/EgtB/PvdO family nonheme iron enzyme, partial [Labilithrix sp.]|nr:SUMF1/EgtB/PvdO family nonheme iron enzyme [Labilithrix sp.]
MLLESLRAARRRRTRTVAALSAGFVLAAAAVACGIDAVATKEFPGLEAGVDAPAEVSLPPKPDGPVDPPDAEAGVDASLSCPTGHGPMVIVDAGGLFFCIDATEVRNDEYAKFVTATDGGNVDSGVFDAGAPDGCVGNTSYAPSSVLGGTDFPVVNIDWCDGNAYCR